MVPSMMLQQMPNDCKMSKCSLYFTKIKSGIAIVSLICSGSLAHSVCVPHQSLMTGILTEKVLI